jgi:DNA-binding MarR family transcriptional regulator
MAWIRKAMKLRGRALAVAVQLLFISGLMKSRTVKVRLASIPISRGAASRGLKALEKAGLVQVRRSRGHWPTIRILETK